MYKVLLIMFDEFHFFKTPAMLDSRDELKYLLKMLKLKSK